MRKHAIDPALTALFATLADARHRRARSKPAEKFKPTCARSGLPDADGVYSLLLSLVKLTERDARRGDPEAAAWLAELTENQSQFEIINQSMR